MQHRVARPGEDGDGDVEHLPIIVDDEHRHGLLCLRPGLDLDSGVEVAREALRLRKGIKALLTSGYAPDVVVAEGADDRFPMLAKPYRHHDLAAAVHRVLQDAHRVA